MGQPRTILEAPDFDRTLKDLNTSSYSEFKIRSILQQIKTASLDREIPLGQEFEEYVGELIYEFNEMLSFGGLTQVGYQCLVDIYRICDCVIRNQIVSNKRLQLISVMTSVSNLFEKYPKEAILTYNSSSNFRFIN